MHKKFSVSIASVAAHFFLPRRILHLSFQQSTGSFWQTPSEAPAESCSESDR